jgi:hypothetical protein
LNFSGKTNFIDLSVLLNKSNRNIRSFELNLFDRFDLFNITDKSIKLIFPEKFNSKLRIFWFDLLNITDKSIKLVFPDKFNSKLRIFRFDLFKSTDKSIKLVFPEKFNSKILEIADV